jgi:hypothetical protein
VVGDGKGIDYVVTRVPISLPCVMPVRPGTEGECDLREPDDRTELCATDAWWMIGAMPICDQHLRVGLREMGDDYEDMLREYRRRHPLPMMGVPNEDERLPWSRRHRYPESIARDPTG